MLNQIWCPNERFYALLIVATIAVASCAKETQPLADSAVAPATPAAPTAAAADTSCPEFGAWRECSVLERLEDAGLVVKREPNPVQLSLFSVPGILFTTSRANIHVFLYPDNASRLRDTEQLDSATVAPRNGTYSWPDPAVLVTSNNLAAVVVSPNERQAERIVLALGAGLPSR
jgi:hypothetical protein